MTLRTPIEVNYKYLTMSDTIMDKEYIIAIIGAVAAILAAIIQRGPLNKKYIIVIIVAVTLIIPAILYYSPNTSAEVDIRIIHPSDSAMVNLIETIFGTANNIPEGKYPWILINPANSSKYYPQKPINIRDDGRWSLPVQFGGEEHLGQKFDIIAILADQEANKEITNYINEGNRTDSWPGIDKIPAGAIVVDKITVTRR